MQTFLPFPDFELSAKVLDTQRLGKQRVEVLQILHTLTGLGGGWKNHPATKMWAGYEWQLCNYGLTICEEWIYERFGYDTCKGQIERIKYRLPATASYNMPWWMGMEEFHASHRSNLMRKAPEHYSKHFQCSPDLPYWWPSEHDEARKD